MKNRYDAVIIGAGVGGIVCGCYLARAGLKVLILERNLNPGGYCVSFKRDNFMFDAGPHSLGSCRKNGQLGKLIKDLDLDEKLKLVRKDPADIVLYMNYEVPFYNDLKKTIEILHNIFPEEAKNVDRFFKVLTTDNIGFLYFKLKNKTFQELLSEFFKNSHLKTIFGIMLGNLGVSATEASAFTSAILYREYIFDGGYYPEGGMQQFSNVLTEKYCALGGDIVYRTLVSKIVVENKRVKGVITADGKKYVSSYVISNCDATHTYGELIDPEWVDVDFLNKLSRLKPSYSFFTAFIGFKKPVQHKYAKASTLWYFPEEDVESIYKSMQEGNVDLRDKYVVCGFPKTCCNADDVFNVIYLLILAPYFNSSYWKKNRDDYAANLINRASRVMPNLFNDISKISIATPADFYRYTRNREGAISGWASIPSQIGNTIVPSKSSIKNLYLVGHWVTSSGGQGGIPMVVYSGKQGAKNILQSINSGLSEK